MNRFFRLMMVPGVIMLLYSFNSSILASQHIQQIVVDGNKRVETSTVLNYLNLKVGGEYTPALVNDGLKNLYATTLFENINTDFSNGILTVRVQENAFISKVIFKGNYKIGTKTLNKEVITRAGESVSQSKIQEDVKKIHQLYKASGRFAVNVTPRIEQLENNRVKVIFDIAEGPKTSIKKIYFVGNGNYKSNELKSVILTKEANFLSFLEKNDTYDPHRIEYDKELLREFYQSVGFADFRVISAIAELAPTKDYFTVTYSIEEGNKYNLGTVTLENKLANIDTKDIEKLIKVKAGELFNEKQLETTAEKVSEYLATKGYPQADVYPDLSDKNYVDRVVNVKFVVDKSERVYVNNINITGNLKTEDKVIRREFKIAEGDLFNRSHLEKAEQRLRNLDYFEKIITSINPTEQADRYNVDVDLQEKSTSSVGFDLGYSTSGGMFGRLAFIERNLIGTGKILNTGIDVGKNSTSYYLGVTEPYFLDKELSLSGNIFKNHNGKKSGWENANQNYKKDTLGFKVGLGYEVTEDLDHEIEYLIKKDHLSGSTASASRFLQDQMGKFITSQIGHTVTYDKIDSRIVPKNGYILSATQELAGLGGDNKYFKHEIDGKYFQSFFKNNLTLKLAGNVGNINGIQGKQVRISDRFNIGEYSLRGFENGGVGPRDKITGEGLGGQNFYTFTSELTFPLGLPKEFNVTGAVFADCGTVWGVKQKKNTTYTKDMYYNDKSLRSSVGVGVIWVTKIAPIRLDWGFPVRKRKYDKTQRFHLKFSAHF